MPQLDVFSFAPQVFWLTFVFFVLYFLLLKDSLNNLYRILFFRKKFLTNLQYVAQSILEESSLLKVFFNSFLHQLLNQKAIFENLIKLSDFFIFKKENFLTPIKKNLFHNSITVSPIAVRQWFLLRHSKKIKI